MIYRHRNPDVRQEPDDLPRGKVGGAFAAVIVISAILSAWASVALDSRERTLRPSGDFPEKRLGPRREVDMVQEELFDAEQPGPILTRREKKTLSSYGWIDREQRTVHIPIDEAMDLVVREGGQ